MKRLVDDGESNCFESSLGDKVTLFCGVYIYTGRLTGVNGLCLELDEAKIVYETGPLDNGAWRDAQNLPNPHHVMISAIESWGPAKC